MADPPPQIPVPLIPPFRHSIIEHGLYRGAHPSLKNFRFLRRLHLRTIISLISEPTGPSRDLPEYCRAEKIRLVWHHVEKYDDGFSHTPQLVASVLSEMVDPRNHPLFLHCRDGSHNTGLVVMCLRRLQNWSLPTIYDEFIRYTKANQITFSEKQFVESFHATITIPTTIPPWLWEGVRHAKHPSIQLALEDEQDGDSSATSSDDGRRESEPNGMLLPPEKVETGVERQRYAPPCHRNIRTHYAVPLAALDICGVHFTKCCRPDIFGEVVQGARHGWWKGARLDAKRKEGLEVRNTSNAREEPSRHEREPPPKL